MIRSIDKALEKISYGYYIITAKKDGRMNGLTVNWLTQISFEPPLVATAISKDRYTHQLIEASSFFLVNIMDKKDWKILEKFGTTTGYDRYKFDDVEYFENEYGLPILKNASAYIMCEVTHILNPGDHTLFIGRVLEGVVMDNKEEEVGSQG